MVSLVLQSIPGCPGPAAVGRENRETGVRPVRDRRRNGRVRAQSCASLRIHAREDGSPDKDARAGRPAPGFILWEQTDCLFWCRTRAADGPDVCVENKGAAYSRALCFAVGLPGFIGSAGFFFFWSRSGKETMDETDSCSGPGPGCAASAGGLRSAVLRGDGIL